MSQDVGRRRSRGGPEVESYGKDHGTDSQQVGQIVVEESPIRLPDPKRRRAPSPSQQAAASPSDHGATRQTSEPATATTGDTTPGKAQDADTVVGNSQETHPGSSSTYFHPPGLRNERQLPSSSRTHSVSARPETSPSTQSNSVGLARLPSLSSIAQDLPVNTFPSHQSPRGLSSPISTRSNHSRHSISSRGSSPHASSSSSSSSAGRRRYGSHVTDGAVSRSASQVPEFRYELVIHQQPGTAAAAGLSPPALSRLPIVPSPILQLRVTNAEGVEVGHRYILQNLPYLVCSCSLVSADEDQAPIDFATEEQPLPASVAGGTSARRPSQPLAMMCGTRVYSSSEAVGLDNQPGVYFIFWDISVRQEGEYRLKFSLVEALPGSPTLTTVVSEPFRVVGRAAFPGTVEIATEWTRHMHRQGLNIYLPALGTSSSALASSITRS